ncbi:MAG: cadmium-translocating P-type ATPase [Clostridiales bacterium]|nr:cadmium-translocating P-type ATPase [Clostridiales bacterium]
METKVYILKNLCCANCAAKIEEKFNAHPGVEKAAIVFTTRQLRLTAQAPDALVKELTELARTVEPDVVITPREERGHHHEEHKACGCGHHHEEHEHEACGCGHHHEEHEHEECGCGHHHEEHKHKECGCGCHHEEHEHEGCSCGHHHEDHDHDGHGESPVGLLLGAGLFVLGLVTSGWWSTGFCLAALVILGWEIAVKAVRGLFRGRVLDENFLMTAAAIGAFFVGNAAEGVGVMLFYRVGEFFEHRAVERSRSQIMDAVDLRPETVTLLNGENMTVIPAEQARVGDVLLVRPGNRIPLDAVVVSGESRLDTAPITGEPVPVAVKPGDAVISGCVNTQGQLTVRVEKPLEESMVTRILRSVESAAAGKPKIDRFITRFARVYTPVVVGIAAATAILPSLVTGNWEYWVYTALSFLVMSCPCALVLSVPLAFFAGIGAGSKKGILFKDGAAMEAMSGIRAVVMDKTGTLTQGDFRVQEIRGDEELLRLCAACEETSTHPIAVSIVSAARERGLQWSRPQELAEIPGRGIRAVLDGKVILCGNEKLMAENGVEIPALEWEYGTRVLAAVDGVYAGALLISDTVKPDAAGAMERLRRRGYTTVMLTGDSREAAQAVAKELGVEECYGSLLPQQKLEILEKLRREKGAAMFVGDGINDAPVLAGADVGAAMGSGADAAIEAADVVFMTSQAGAIPEALDIAKKTARIAWQNVVFALAVKLVVMVLGLLGFASMWLAVFADSGVAMLCVLNSIRLLYRKGKA